MIYNLEITRLSKMWYKMATNINCLALGEQYGYAQLTGPFLINMR